MQSLSADSCGSSHLESVDCIDTAGAPLRADCIDFAEAPAFWLVLASSFSILVADDFGKAISPACWTPTTPCKKLDVSLPFVGVHVLVPSQLVVVGGVALGREVACPLYGFLGMRAIPKGIRAR